MSNFVKPSGICFIFGNELPAQVLTSVLKKIVNFLQDASPCIKLKKYDDWWEHDGLHFYRDTIDFDAVYQMIKSPKSLLETTPDDDFVFIGIAPEDNSWYLRYRVEWNNEETCLIGSCFVILPESLDKKFREIDWEDLTNKPEEKDSASFYQEIIL